MDKIIYLLGIELRMKCSKCKNEISSKKELVIAYLPSQRMPIVSVLHHQCFNDLKKKTFFAMIPITLTQLIEIKESQKKGQFLGLILMIPAVLIIAYWRNIRSYLLVLMLGIVMIIFGLITFFRLFYLNYYIKRIEKLN